MKLVDKVTLAELEEMASKIQGNSSMTISDESVRDLIREIISEVVTAT